MNNFNVIMKKICSFYTRQKGDRGLFLANHETLISLLFSYWIDKEIQSPIDGQHVLTIQDMRSISKGAYVGEYYYEDGGFVANRGDTDPYGFITHWISADTINNLILCDIDKSGFLKEY